MSTLLSRGIEGPKTILKLNGPPVACNNEDVGAGGGSCAYCRHNNSNCMLHDADELARRSQQNIWMKWNIFLLLSNVKSSYIKTTPSRIERQKLHGQLE